ncbi:ABC transporter permease [Eggerthellaceae bacterium zg-1084]|uniref:ABC transporter permease n=1 Tax=Berryella wangjianweii TaxID=2734634 RepID=A0A6M8IVS9_9ACTN|nr:methionine ABC transporter permease [Berryella wangjianweii]NPD31133.1 ABC transporter permease [Berryella wangjianweii]NPD32558.1 ABC transporter permease [Eggerthellaceae bacterium zg-997]QKF06695.1 ABC transporter permease [Berryella wangjianweii]
MEPIQEFFDKYGQLLAQGTVESLVMTGVATLLAYAIGLVAGAVLVVTAPGGLRENRVVYGALGWVVNVVRSVPFIILLVAIIPFTRLIAGTSLGIAGGIVPLTVTAAPFVARVVEQSLAEVSTGLTEAAQSFGANNLQIIRKVLLRESVPSLIRGATLTFITLFGFAAMAGAVGAGGLGDIAIRYGYQRYQSDVMLAAVVLCVVIVQVVQALGDFAARKLDHRA